jgi:hydroxymethylpyrimidine pyrophosphatase-like HAD family hydrolase
MLSPQFNVKLTMYEDTYRPNFWYLEIFSAKASKQNAVNYLRNTYDFERVVGFGDNLNDLPMFAACDVKIAVKNAKPEVKAAADYICGANDDDGVVKWLEDSYIQNGRKAKP